MAFNILQSAFIRIDSISRNFFFCSFTRTNSLHVQSLSWDCSNLVISLGSTFNSLAISSTFAVTSSLKYEYKVWGPQRLQPIRVEVNCFQTPVSVDIFTSTHQSQMSLMASRRVNCFQRFSFDFVQIHQRNHYLWQLQHYKIYLK